MFILTTPMNLFYIVLAIFLFVYLFKDTQALEGFHNDGEFKIRDGGLPGLSNCSSPPDFTVAKDGEWHLFKKPNYYGLGTWGYHYEEPFYWRHRNA